MNSPFKKETMDCPFKEADLFGEEDELPVNQRTFTDINQVRRSPKRKKL